MKARGRRNASPILCALVIAALAYVGTRVHNHAFTMLHGGERRPVRFHLPRLRTSGISGARRAAESREDNKINTEAFMFQAEVGKVMDIIINSLYSNRDVFLRELVSNAADACDKKRFRHMLQQEEAPEEMRIRIKADKESHTLTIEDNGIGMNKSELVRNLGSVARSGTADFAAQLSNRSAATNLIGQFGVGFYSAFLVADKVEVFSRSFQDVLGQHNIWRWASEGESFTIEDLGNEELFEETSGTRVVLHLKKDAAEYLDRGKLAGLLSKYSEFFAFPIELWNEEVRYDQLENEADENKTKTLPRSEFEWEVMNRLKPIWLRSPEDIGQSEYTEFYRNTFKTFDDPLATTHFKVEGQTEFRALVFIPTDMPFELTRDMFAESGRAMRLYVKRVFINDKFEDLVPRWLTFVRGVVDAEDLPLNVGREILQQSRALNIIRKRIVRKVLDTIHELRENTPLKFQQLLANYARYFKVGLIDDLEYRSALKPFVYFFSSESGNRTTSLSEYASRMKEGQNDIYFVTGEGRSAVEIAPAMEKMRQMDYEVLYMLDPLDEICIRNLGEFNGHKVVDINTVGLNINMTEEEKQQREATAEEFQALTTWLKSKLGHKVEEVRISDRLVESPAAVVQGAWGMSPMMQRYMKSASNTPDSPFAMGIADQAILEINPKHPIIASLRIAMETSPDDEETEAKIALLFEIAALLGGYAIEDLGGFAARVTKLM